MRVYIIHSQEERFLSHVVSQALSESGHSVWIDWPASTRSFEEELRHYMQASQLIVVIWTPTTDKSRLVHTEWEIARPLQKRMILVSVAGAQPDDIPSFCDIVSAPTADDVATSLTRYIDANPGHRIFISYATEDVKATQRLLALINRSRHEVWLDRFSIDPGTDFPLEILRGIDDCNYFFLIWSHQAQQSSWVEREWQYAYSKSREIIPVLLDNTPLPAKIEHINGYRGVDVQGICNFLGIAEPANKSLHRSWFAAGKLFRSFGRLFRRKPTR